jgi:hypothetical protein
MGRFMVVDSDAHINEPMEAFERFLEEPYQSRRPRIIKDTLGLTRILLEGRLYPEPRLKQAHSRQIEGPKLGGPLTGSRRHRLSGPDGWHSVRRGGPDSANHRP